MKSRRTQLQTDQPTGDQGPMCQAPTAGRGNAAAQELLALRQQDTTNAAPDGLGGGDALEEDAELGSGYGTTRATYKGVPARSNGDEPRFNDAPYGEYGIEYQCVEYVNRFSAQAMGLANMKGTGHAISYAGAGRSGLTWVPNVAGPYLPAPGDILVFAAGGYGHVSINMSEPGERSIRTIQQNTGSPNDTLQVGGPPGQWVIAGGGTGSLLGWQHVGTLDDSTRVEGELTDGPSQSLEGDQTTQDQVPVEAAVIATDQQYTVQTGDTLSAIAAQLLGSSARWTDLYDQNRDVLGDNPNLIYPGQVLTWSDGSVVAGGATAEALQGSQESVTQGPGSTIFDLDGSGEAAIDLESYLEILETYEFLVFDPDQDLQTRLTSLRRHAAEYTSTQWDMVLPGTAGQDTQLRSPKLETQRMVALPGGQVVDMMHLFATLEGRLRGGWLDLAPGPDTASITGWMGDLASVMVRVLNTQATGASWQSAVDAVAGGADMLANIDAWVLASQAESAYDQAPTSVTELLRAYYSGAPGSGVERRYSAFADVLGLSATNVGLLGRTTFVEDQAPKLADLVGLFLIFDDLGNVVEPLAQLVADGDIELDMTDLGTVIDLAFSLSAVADEGILPYLRPELVVQDAKQLIDSFLDALQAEAATEPGGMYDNLA